MHSFFAALLLTAASVVAVGCATPPVFREDYLPVIASELSLASLQADSPHPPPNVDCPCNGTKVITHGDGHKTPCPCGPSCRCQPKDVPVAPAVMPTAIPDPRAVAPEASRRKTEASPRPRRRGLFGRRRLADAAAAPTRGGGMAC